jgi:two-component system, NtrC family, nitrogen regulation sensor histidine kinase NtrY
MQSPASGSLPATPARIGGSAPARGGGPSPEEKEAKRKRREILIIILLLLIFVSLTAAEFSIRGVRTFLPFNDSILFFTIININILLTLLMVFLILRNVVKLVLERRRRILGAHLRTKLVAAFVLLSLVPTVILFYVAWSFISRSIEMWVHVQVEQALDGALEVARNYYKGRAEDVLYYARQIGQACQREGYLEQKETGNLREFLRLQQIAYRVDAVFLLDPEQGQILESLLPEKPAVPLPAEPRLLLGSWEEEETARIREMGEGEVIEAMVPIPYTVAGQPGKAILVLQNYVPLGLVEKMAQISKTIERHQQMMLYKFSFKSVFFMALIMVTLLIVFAATWFGFYLAKEITTPLQHLADGIREVAAGNLSHRLEAGTGDEMGILVDSYNKMLEDLRRKGEEVAEAQGCLHQTNEELDRRRRYVEILLRNVGAGVLSLDREGRIQTVNRFMEELFSIEAAAFVGKNYRDLFRAEAMQPVLEIIEEVDRRRSRNLERQIRVTLLEEPRTLLVRSSALEDEAGQWVGTVMVFEDHSELIRAQRAAAWREVARRIAHEIKNPLTPIQLSAQRLQKRFLGRFGQDSEIFEECTNTIIRQVEVMKNLVNEFSQFARMPAARPVMSSLNEIVTQVLALYRQAHQAVKFIFEPDENLPRFPLDPDQIRRALINLLDNAIDATRGAGEVSLRTRYIPFPQIAVLEIADNGCGISEDMRDRVFEPYASSKRGGTGLGLVIVKTIVAGHSGYIRVKDNAPRGTRFFLEFPLPAA